MIRKQLEKIVDFGPGELVPAVLAAGAFFCLLFAYFMLRPLREAMGLAGGVDSLRLLFLGTLAVVLLVNIAWGAVVAVLPRRVFVPLVYRVAIGCLVVFGILLQSAGNQANPLVGRVFFIWLSVFNLLAISVFWQLMVDMFDLEQAKRLFGFIAMGGTAGAIAGSAYAWQLAEIIGPVWLIVSAAILIEGATQLCRLVSRRTGTVGEAAAAIEQPVGGAAWSGVRRVLQSPYLLAIAAYVLIFTVCSTLLYFEKMRIVEAAVEGREARTEVFALIELVGQVATVLLQVFFTGRLMRSIGVGAMLAVVPLMFLVGFAALIVAPTLLTITVLDAARRACNHGCSKPARETLFTVVTRDDKFKAKAIIDTFVYRGGDVVGTLADKGVAALGAFVAVVGMPLCLLGVGVAAWLGRQERVRRDQQTPHVQEGSR